MILLLSFLMFVPAVLNIPAWFYAQKHRGASVFLLWLQAPALLVWGGLLWSGVGRATLSNMEEGVWIVLVGVALVYLQVFVVDRILSRPARTTAILTATLCIAAVILRLFMPPLHE